MASRPLRAGRWCLLALLIAASGHGQQIADPDFSATVLRPAYAGNGPTVSIDEAHSNFHTASGRYKPLADLLRSDGYHVVAGTRTFDEGALAGVDVLVIANALSAEGDNPTGPAFTDRECEVVSNWVRDGGALLLIADHAPFGSAAENLGQRFGVAMGKGWAWERADQRAGITTQLVFSRENGLLGNHPILSGRDPAEQVRRVRSFTGQSLGVPPGATALLSLSPTARESPLPADLDAADAAVRSPGTGDPDAHSSPVGGRAQGVALAFGRGRLVVLGEAGMLSAQVIRYTEGGQPREMKMGMNVPGYDGQQFALNVLHWLSRLLP